jgi:hypothetical protein
MGKTPNPTPGPGASVKKGTARYYDEAYIHKKTGKTGRWVPDMFVYPDRKSACVFYNDCLGLAASAAWQSFNCQKCRVERRKADPDMIECLESLGRLLEQ